MTVTNLHKSVVGKHFRKEQSSGIVSPKVEADVDAIVFLSSYFQRCFHAHERKGQQVHILRKDRFRYLIVFIGTEKVRCAVSPNKKSWRSGLFESRSGSDFSTAKWRWCCWIEGFPCIRWSCFVPSKNCFLLKKIKRKNIPWFPFFRDNQNLQCKTDKNKFIKRS